MKLILTFVGILLMSLASGCTWHSGHNHPGGLDVVAQALCRQMNSDSHWFDSWIEQSNRTLRVVTVGPQSYLAAFEVYPSDLLPLSQPPGKWQVAFLDLSRGYPMIQFPSRPCTPEKLLANRRKGMFAEIKETDLMALISGDDCASTNFIFKKIDQTFVHDRTWKVEIDSLEAALRAFIAEKRIHSGFFLFGDIVYGDQECHGLCICEDGRLCFRIVGVRAPTGSESRAEWSLVYEQVDAAGLRELQRLMVAPLVWDIAERKDRIIITLISAGVRPYAR